MPRERLLILLTAAIGVCFPLPAAAQQAADEANAKPFLIQVIDRETRWPVSLVELRTNHQVRFVTDNAGRVAFDLPELMGEETWLTIEADGYEAPADGFGYRGVRLTPRPGESATVEVDRTSIAKRLGRLTGAGMARPPLTRCSSSSTQPNR